MNRNQSSPDINVNTATMVSMIMQWITESRNMSFAENEVLAKKRAKPEDFIYKLQNIVITGNID